jgi:hypothetical protein
MTASRGARYLLRNGLDYINYREYSRALRYLRAAESKQNELEAPELKALKQGIEQAQRGLRETGDPRTGLAANRNRPVGAIAAAVPTVEPNRPAPMRSSDGIQLTSGTQVETPADPAPSGVLLPPLEDAPAQPKVMPAPAPVQSTREMPLDTPKPGTLLPPGEPTELSPPPASLADPAATPSAPLKPEAVLPAVTPAPEASKPAAPELPTFAPEPVVPASNPAPSLPEVKSEPTPALPVPEAARPASPPVLTLETLPEPAAPIAAPADLKGPTSAPAPEVHDEAKPTTAPKAIELPALPKEVSLPLPESAKGSTDLLPALPGESASGPTAAPAALNLPEPAKSTTPDATPASVQLPEPAPTTPLATPPATAAPTEIALPAMSVPDQTPKGTNAASGDVTPPPAPPAEEVRPSGAEPASLPTLPDANREDVGARAGTNQPTPRFRPETEAAIARMAKLQDDESKTRAGQPSQLPKPLNLVSPNPVDQPGVGGENAAPLPSSSTKLEISRAPSPTEAWPIRRIPIPEEFVPIQPRSWEPARKYWQAPAFCHMPLYFQDASLERYGHSVEQFFGPAGRFMTYPVDDKTQSKQRMQILQPMFSIGLFAWQVGTLPYKMFVDPPWEAEYDLGYYRPGDRIPNDVYYLPLHGVGPVFPPVKGRKW